MQCEEQLKDSSDAKLEEDQILPKRPRPEAPTLAAQPASPADHVAGTSNGSHTDRPQQPVDVLAERLQELSISQGFGCITGPGIISGHPCPLVADRVRCRFEVGGVEVLFPFVQPLEPQKAVMKSVLEALSLGIWASQGHDLVVEMFSLVVA